MRKAAADGDVMFMSALLRIGKGVLVEAYAQK